MWLLLLIPVAGYILSTKCRIGSRGLESLRGRFYAHRGVHTPGIPENSLGAFQRAVEHGYGIELDVHLLRDGNLAVIHDHSLKRTAGADVMIEVNQELMKEAGDILWQLAGLCRVMGWNLDDIAQMNLKKLASRQRRGVIDGKGDNR